MADHRFNSGISNKFRFLLTNAAGDGLPGLAFDTAGLIISTIADNESAAVPYTQAAGNIQDITTVGLFEAPAAGKCRFKEVDAVNHTGVYEFQFLDARFAVANSTRLVLTVSGAVGLAAQSYEIEYNLFGLLQAAVRADALFANRAILLALLNLGGGTYDNTEQQTSEIALIEGDDPSDFMDARIAAALAAIVPDTVPAVGTRPSVQQALYMLSQLLTQSTIVGTTWTVYKPDGVTVLFTLTLDNAALPTSKIRAT